MTDISATVEQGSMDDGASESRWLPRLAAVLAVVDGRPHDRAQSPSSRTRRGWSLRPSTFGGPPTPETRG
jgi:hypothetical protein